MVGAANERLFGKLCTALGHLPWARDSRFENNALRMQYKTELLAMIEPVFWGVSTQVWIVRLQAAGVPFAPVNDLAGAMRYEQVQASVQLQMLPNIGLPIVGLTLSFGSERPMVRAAAPALGERNTLYGLPAIPTSFSRSKP